MPQTAEYFDLKAFLRHFTERYGESRELPPLKRPLAVLESVERENPARASAALRMAVNNCLELSGHWPFAQVVALDAELPTQGILSLSQVRRRVWGRYAAIVKHGKLRSEAEYQVVRAVLADQTLGPTLPPAERERLQTAMLAFEKRANHPFGQIHSSPRPARSARVKR